MGDSPLKPSEERRGPAGVDREGLAAPDRGRGLGLDPRRTCVCSTTSAGLPDERPTNRTARRIRNPGCRSNRASQA